MSETPKRKRLTDGDVDGGHDAIKGRHFLCDPTCTHSSLREVLADHLQAREDRDAAVRLLVDCMTDALPPALAERIRTFIVEVES